MYRKVVASPQLIYIYVRVYVVTALTNKKFNRININSTCLTSLMLTNLLVQYLKCLTAMPQLIKIHQILVYWKQPKSNMNGWLLFEILLASVSNGITKQLLIERRATYDLLDLQEDICRFKYIISLHFQSWAIFVYSGPTNHVWSSYPVNNDSL